MLHHYTAAGLRVRGLALDIMGADKDSLHLQHGHGIVSSKTDWKTVLNELNSWLTRNPREIVTLFFESYLTGPKPGQTTPTPLSALDETLRETIGCYKSGKAAQTDALLNRNFSYLIDGIKNLNPAILRLTNHPLPAGLNAGTTLLTGLVVSK